MYLGMLFCIMILMLYIRDEMKKLSQKYADRIVEHSNIVTKNFIESVKTSRKKKTSIIPMHVINNSIC